MKTKISLPSLVPKIFLLAALGMTGNRCFSQQAQLSGKEYKEDFNFFWNSINDEYCYFNKKQTDWQKVKDSYSPLIDRVNNRDQFVSVLEKALYEIYDHHAVLNTNTDSSQRLVPSGTDIWAEYINGKPIITEVRKNFGAAQCGIVAGMEVITINNIPVNEAVDAFLPQALKQADTEAGNFVLRILLAGNHVKHRKFSLKYNGVTREYSPDDNGFVMDKQRREAMVDSKQIGTVGYIKINDCLYNNALIPVFDSVMETMNTTTAMIIDLRETPGGGNTSVARAILGWFISREQFYQKHEYYYEEKSTGIKRSWEEIVSPRAGKYYSKPLVVLCDHWTGSIAEGITIGFDAVNRPGTMIIGTAMAGLNGAVYSYEMPNSKIHFAFPAERLYHINGLPREKYVPPVLINVLGKPMNGQQDIFIDRALAYFKSLKN
ncbi:MAG: peptidase [Bacteroidetes bacterium]|nr:peptidase [Bacteroidota bacterium]